MVTRLFLVGFALILTFVAPALGQSRTGVPRLTVTELEGFPENILVLAQDADKEAEASREARAAAAEEIIKTRAELLALLEKAEASHDLLQAAVSKFSVAYKVAFNSEALLRAKDNRVRMEYRESLLTLGEGQIARFVNWERSLFANYFLLARDDFRLLERGYTATKAKK